MAPRKRELLDVLRTRQKASSAHAPTAPPPAPSQPQPGRAHTAASRTVLPRLQGRWLLRAAFTLLWLALVVWLLMLLWPDGDTGAGVAQDPTAAGRSGARPEETGEQGRRQDPQATPASAEGRAAAQPALAVASSFGVLAITYEGVQNEPQARAIALEMRDSLGLPEVQVRKHLSGGKTWYEIYVGRAAEKSALEPLLRKVRGLSLPAQPGQKPFADAFIRTIPVTTS